MMELLRKDWETWTPDIRTEARWLGKKTWGGKIVFERDAAWSLLVGENAHRRMIEVWRTVRSIEIAVPDMLRERVTGTPWPKDLASDIVVRIGERLEASGIARGGALWLAGDRAAARMVQKVRDRVLQKKKDGGFIERPGGWNRGFRPREIAPTIRLGVGYHYDRPLMEVARDGYALLSDGGFLLGEFGAVPPSAGFSVSPLACSYAECALLSAGWAIRFIAVRPAAERGAVKGAENEVSPPPY